MFLLSRIFLKNLGWIQSIINNIGINTNDIYQRIIIKGFLTLLAKVLFMKAVTYWWRYKESFIAILTYLIVILIFYNDGIKDEKLVIGLFAVITSVYFGVLKNNTENDKVFNQLFKEFNAKYENEFREVLMEIDHKTAEGSKDFLLNRQQSDQIVQYLNLCAEEFFWYKKGRIPNTVWNSWLIGIKYYLELPAIQQVVRQEKSQKGSYYGFFDALNLKKK